MAQRDRWFSLGFGAAALSAIAIGFGPSFYLRPGRLPALAPVVIAHGLLFTSWVVLFIVQAALVAAGGSALHRRLGVAGAGLAATMVVSAPPMAVSLARRGLPPGDPIGFLLVVLTDLLLFGTFVGAGLYHRHRRETHQRLMMLALVSLLPPAISRWPVAIAHPAPVIAGTITVFVLAAPVADWLASRRIDRVSLWGGVAVLVSLPLRFAVAHTAAWQAVANRLIH
jgi:hypothetical protein